MSLVEISLGALVLLPLLAAAILAVLPHLARRVLGTFTAVAITALAVPVIIPIADGETLELSLGGYGAPLGILLRADGLSAIFIALTAVVGVCVTGFAALIDSSTGTRMNTAYQPVSGHPGFWPLWFGAWAGLNAVFVSGDLFNTYVGLELVGLTAVGLVALGGAGSWAAALRYLFIAVLGSLFFLVAVGMIVSVTGTLDINQAAGALIEESDNYGVAFITLVLLSLGLAMKVALLPVHHWLVPAHSGAPSAVSPLLSALVIKAALFVFLRCWGWIAIPIAIAGPANTTFNFATATTILAWIFASMGILALVVGSIMALRQTHLKPLIAYSTVAQVGYWFLLLPILTIPQGDSLADPAITFMDDTGVKTGALAGTIGLIVGHGLAKAGLFLTAGYFKERYGTDEIYALHGVARSHPALVMTMGLTAVGLAGLPFSISFSGKWQLTSSAVAAGHYWLLPVIVIATLLSAAYLLKAIAPLMMQHGPDGEPIERPKPIRDDISVMAQAAPMVLGVLTVVTGFLGAPVFELVETGVSW
jgi:formate hydrogenlyase subunit 3/multisubunit Na+/H+ antiporter MnhD subunit